MALEHIARVRDLELLPLQKLLLYALASRANHAGRCWPSISRVCRDTGLSRRTVQIHLGHLTTSGALVREGRRGRSNVYRLTLDSLARGSLPGPSREDVAAPAPSLKERIACAPPAHDLRTPAHRMPDPSARHAPEVPREVSLREQWKPSIVETAVDNSVGSIPWWRSRPAVMQRGEELGLSPRPGETYPVYKDRVYRASLERKA